MKSKVVHIGPNAIDEKEPILVLFGEDATPAIKNVSVLQKFEKDTDFFDLKSGDQLSFGGQIYDIQHVGQNVNANLHSIGHITLIFKEFNQERYLETSVYLHPYNVPAITKGMQIEYISKH